MAQSDPELTPYDVEAAYLYNFGKFVQWPVDSASSSQPFSICILGEDNFGRKLDDLIADDTIQGRKIVARRLSSPDSADNCQIVFIGLSEDAHLKKDIDALEKRPILTVSNLPHFLERGGMIQFLQQNRRVRFAVNLSAAEQTHLSMSSELLKVAIYVNRPATQEVE
ncbi:MAG: YfiR family protein [Terracidiphilus sp.]